MRKIRKLTNDKVTFSIVWTAKKIKPLFRIKDIKDKLNDFSYIIHKENCSCGSKYLAKIFRNSETKFSEYEKLNGISEPLKYFRNNLEFEFSWKVLTRAPSSWLHY